MAPLSTVSRALARSSLRLPAAATTATATTTTTTAARAMSSSPALSAAASSSTFESPFKGERKTTKVPDFSKYMAKGSSQSNAVFSYFMVGTLGALTAAGAKNTIHGEFLLFFDVRFSCDCCCGVEEGLVRLVAVVIEVRGEG